MAAQTLKSALNTSARSCYVYETFGRPRDATNLNDSMLDLGRDPVHAAAMSPAHASNWTADCVLMLMVTHRHCNGHVHDMPYEDIVRGIE